MQTAIMTIFQFTPEEVVEIRVGVGGEEVMSRSGRISGDEVVFVVRCVFFRDDLLWSAIGICFGVLRKVCESDNHHRKDFE